MPPLSERRHGRRTPQAECEGEMLSTGPGKKVPGGHVIGHENCEDSNSELRIENQAEEPKWLASSFSIHNSNLRNSSSHGANTARCGALFCEELYLAQ